MISDNENGYLFEFQNIDEVKNLILDLSNDNSKKLYMGKLSKEKIKPYLLDNILIKMKEIYRLWLNGMKGDYMKKLITNIHWILIWKGDRYEYSFF